MARLFKRVRKKAGLEPGALVWSGAERTSPVHMSVVSYSEASFNEEKPAALKDVLVPKDHPGIAWIDVYGIHDLGLVEEIGTYFGLHPLVLEDIVTSGQRPKLEDYGDYLFLTIKMLSFKREEMRVDSEEMSIIIGSNYVLSFQETPEDTFRPVKERLRKGTDRFAKAGPDYLAYALVDMVVDNYFTVLEELGELFEELQDQVLANPTPQTLDTVHRLKNDLIVLRKSVWPLRDAIAVMQRHDSPLIGKETELYLRDVQDHTIQIMDTIETFRDILSGTLDIYLSSVSNRLNSVMKVLTIIATIFIPLTFIAGVYGMNFDFMPELHWRYGYPAIMSLMFILGVGMLFWFRKNKWL